MRIILASASPRRKELLAQLRPCFDIQVSDVEEIVTQSDPAKVVEELSDQKAAAVFKQTEGGREINGKDPAKSQGNDQPGKGFYTSTGP